MGDPIPSQLDILRLLFRLRFLEGDELDEAVTKLEELLKSPPGPYILRFQDFYCA